MIIDFERAFDLVDFQFLVTSLEVFEFGENFKTWIKIILGYKEGTQFNTVTVVNGNISKPFEIRRGCRQGDPISGYLFILVMEILALLLLKHPPSKTLQNKAGFSALPRHVC